MTRCPRIGAVSSSVVGVALHVGAALIAAPACTSAPTPTATPGPPSRTEPEAAAAARASMRTFPLNTYKRELDGQWQGIRLASDGNVYFASSSHSAHHGGSFFEYDTRTGKITELVHDITEICGEDPQTNPQGKIHNDIVESNGWLYMATHYAADKPGV